MVQPLLNKTRTQTRQDYEPHPTQNLKESPTHTRIESTFKFPLVQHGTSATSLLISTSAKDVRTMFTNLEPKVYHQPVRWPKDFAARKHSNQPKRRVHALPNEPADQATRSLKRQRGSLSGLGFTHQRDFL